MRRAQARKHLILLVPPRGLEPRTPRSTSRTTTSKFKAYFHFSRIVRGIVDQQVTLGVEMVPPRQPTRNLTTRSLSSLWCPHDGGAQAQGWNSPAWSEASS